MTLFTLLISLQRAVNLFSLGVKIMFLFRFLIIVAFAMPTLSGYTRLKSMECHAVDPKFLQVTNCIIKPIRRNIKDVHVVLKLLQGPVTNASVGRLVLCSCYMVFDYLWTLYRFVWNWNSAAIISLFCMDSLWMRADFWMPTIVIRWPMFSITFSSSTFTQTWIIRVRSACVYENQLHIDVVSIPYCRIASSSTTCATTRNSVCPCPCPWATTN